MGPILPNSKKAIEARMRGRILTVSRSGMQHVETESSGQNKFLQFYGTNHIPDGGVGDIVALEYWVTRDQFGNAYAGLWHGRVVEKFSGKL